MWRSANIFGASFIFTIGKRYQHQPSDTMKTPNTIPLYHYGDLTEFHWPSSSEIVGIEIDDQSKELTEFRHPKQCVYLLGAEDSGLPQDVLEICDYVVEVPTLKPFCLNVAVTGSIVMHDRFMKCKESSR